MNKVLRWAVMMAIAAGLLFGLFIYAVSRLDIDIPCQDGRWDAERKTCIPDVK